MVLVVVVLLQVIGLAVQVRKATPVSASVVTGFSRDMKDGRGVLLIRLWAAMMVTPFERVMHGGSQGVGGFWANYVDLRHTREENRQLKETLDRLRLEQAMLREDALQGQRLQALIKFQQKYINKTMAAQVIGTSGSSLSHVIYLDKGSADGLQPDMAVITGDGIVGKVRDVFPHSAQVLVINDQTSGAGVVLETTRIRGILRGDAFGQPQVVNILADSRIKAGERVLTAGGDRIFPRGLAVGTVERVERDPERGSFINVTVKPAANLQHLDEVLVVTSLDEHLSAQELEDIATSDQMKGGEADSERKKAAAEMASRLPGLKDEKGAEVGPDGKPVEKKAGEAGPDGKLGSPTAALPKPLAPRHEDRFSPGSGAETPTQTPVVAPDVNVASRPTAKVSRPAARNSTGKKPTAPKRRSDRKPGGQR